MGNSLFETEYSSRPFVFFVTFSQNKKVEHGEPKR